MLWEWEGEFTPCFKISHIRSAIRELLAIFITTLFICLTKLESANVQSHICAHLPDSGQYSESFDSDLQ